MVADTTAVPGVPAARPSTSPPSSVSATPVSGLISLEASQESWSDRFSTSIPDGAVLQVTAGDMAGDVAGDVAVVAAGYAAGDTAGHTALASTIPDKSQTQDIFEQSFPFEGLDDELLTPLPGIPKPAEPLLRTGSLKEVQLHLRGGHVFVDRALPAPAVKTKPNSEYSMSYFTALHSMVVAEGQSWPAWTPNHLGARIPLSHSNLKVDKWRQHLIGYENVEICQYIEFGFPLGLSTDPPAPLVSTYRNHGSSYQYYTYWDKFTASGVQNRDLVGPFTQSPFPQIHISPVMTAIKKPDSRRCVFDASFGDHSLNNNTPADHYMGQPIDYAYPRIEDFRRLIIKCGVGCFIWKRDLSRYYLQIPLCPSDYPLVCFVWRSAVYFFAGLMFGLKHSGYQAQRLTDAVTWIHARLGLEHEGGKMFNSINYSDDIGGAETTLARATESSNALASLLVDLGLEESKSKEHKPSTKMPYLGVLFDTQKMTMSVPPEKMAEVREELTAWKRKTTASKKSLQKLLGKLFLISRCVRHSRPFMARLLNQLKTMHHQTDTKKTKLSSECHLDILWWDRFLRHFNGVQVIYNDEPILLSLDQLLDSGAVVNCGDAQMWGGGAYYADQYWSRPFPDWLKNANIPIHIKEFWVVVASAWLWGDSWSGKVVHIFCDNDAVCDTLDKEKPKDKAMQELLREFLYIVCSKGFSPVFRKIGTVANKTADYLSRVHDHNLIREFFKQSGLPRRHPVNVPDTFFQLHSNW